MSGKHGAELYAERKRRAAQHAAKAKERAAITLRVETAGFSGGDLYEVINEARTQR